MKCNEGKRGNGGENGKEEGRIKEKRR